MTGDRLPRSRNQRLVLVLATLVGTAASVLAIINTGLWGSLWDKELTAPEELLIVAVVGLAVTGLTTWLRRRDSDARIGKPNGQGNVVKMLEDQGALLREQGTRIDKLTQSFIEHAESNSREHDAIWTEVGGLRAKVGELSRGADVHGGG